MSSSMSSSLSSSMAKAPHPNRPTDRPDDPHKTVVIVSPYFPPSTLAGVHRARHLAKHLPAAGWWPIVLMADPATHTQSADPALLTLVPESVERVTTKALPAALTRKAGLSDLGIRAYPYLRRALMHLIDTRPIDAVLITGSPYYPMMMAGALRRRGVPTVLDFQDPWVSAHGATVPKLSKEGIAHQLGVVLESKAVRHADWITSVSQVQNEQLCAHYPFLDGAAMSAIPIGGDPEDFAILRSRGASEGEVRLDPDRIEFSYVGTYLPNATPLTRQVFRAAAMVKREAPDLAARLRLNFIGTSNSPDGRTAQVSALAAQEGVADLVREVPQRIPFLDALTVLANSNALLLIGSDEPHYTASKIYPALMSGTPFLSLFHDRSSAHQILSAAGGGYALSFTDPATLEGLASRIAERMIDLARGQPPLTPPLTPPSAEAYAPYTAAAVSQSFAAIFNTISAPEFRAGGIGPSKRALQGAKQETR